MINILVSIAFTILVFSFFGSVLYLAKYKRRKEAVTPDKAGQGCSFCGGSHCCSE
jgi:hypothetical protein